MSVTETPFFFGETHPLFGILSEPELVTSKCGVVVLNSGLVHRAGPFRLGVEISRALAAAGVPTMRFDQSARGDSERRKGVDVVAAAELDIQSAKAAFRSHTGLDKVVLAGLCSGADDIIRHAAVADDIDGMILMDPYAPKNRKYYMQHYLPRVLDAQKVIRFASRKLGANAAFGDTVEEAETVDLGAFREFPSDDQARAAYLGINERQGASLCVFTSGVSDYYNYEGQLVEALEVGDVSGTIEEVFLKTSEHTFPIVAHRRRLVETIVDFCTRRFIS